MQLLEKDCVILKESAYYWFCKQCKQLRAPLAAGIPDLGFSISGLLLLTDKGAKIARRLKEISENAVNYHPQVG